MPAGGTHKLGNIQQAMNGNAQDDPFHWTDIICISTRQISIGYHGTHYFWIFHQLKRVSQTTSISLGRLWEAFIPERTCSLTFCLISKFCINSSQPLPLCGFLSQAGFLPCYQSLEVLGFRFPHHLQSQNVSFPKNSVEVLCFHFMA